MFPPSRENPFAMIWEILVSMTSYFLFSFCCFLVFWRSKHGFVSSAFAFRSRNHLGACESVAFSDFTTRIEAVGLTHLTGLGTWLHGGIGSSRRPIWRSNWGHGGKVPILFLEARGLLSLHVLSYIIFVWPRKRNWWRNWHIHIL